MIRDTRSASALTSGIAPCACGAGGGGNPALCASVVALVVLAPVTSRWIVRAGLLARAELALAPSGAGAAEPPAEAGLRQTMPGSDGAGAAEDGDAARPTRGSDPGADEARRAMAGEGSPDPGAVARATGSPAGEGAAVPAASVRSARAITGRSPAGAASGSRVARATRGSPEATAWDPLPCTGVARATTGAPAG